MPAIFAHKLIAQIALPKYSREVQALINRYKDSYLVASLGPDPLYFYGFTKALPLTKEADIIHRMQAKNLFLKKEVSEEFLVFLLGFLTHYTLDKNVHQYIHQIEHLYSHIKIERELEYLLLKENKIDIKKYKFAQHIKLNSSILPEVAKFLNLEEKTTLKAYKDTALIVKYAYDIKPFKRRLVNMIMKLTKTYENNKDMLLSTDLDENYSEVLNKVYNLFLASIEEVVLNVNNYYDYIKSNGSLNSNFNYNFEGEKYD